MLTAKQAQFCIEYLIDLNASAAYKRAGYKGTDKTANVEGSRLLAKPSIQAEIQKLRAEQKTRTEVTIDRVVQELAAIAFAKVDDVANYGPGGVNLRPVKEIPKDARAAVKSVSSSPGKHGDTVSLQMHNKDAALDKLMQFLGMKNDFNMALVALKKYGLELQQDSDGNWVVNETA